MKLRVATRTDDDPFAFVGLQQTENQLVLRLPLGFEWPQERSEKDVWLARRLVRNTLRKFVEEEFARRQLKKLTAASRKPTNPVEPASLGEATRGVAEAQTGEKITDQESLTWQGDELFLQSFLRDQVFDALVDQMRRPEVLVVRRRQGWIDGFDARHLHRAWPRAIFTQTGPVFEAMPGPRRELADDPNHAVTRLAAWLALDYLKHVEGVTGQGQSDSGAEPNPLAVVWTPVELLRKEFVAEQGFTDDTSLFVDAPSRWSMKEVKRHLRMVLADLNKRHRGALPAVRELLALCDEAVSAQTKLGEQGDVFGLKGFYRVWEALCAHHALSTEKRLDQDQVFCMDPAGAVPDHWSKYEQTWLANNKRVFEISGHLRRRPDLVLSEHEDKSKIERIIDFKYYDAIEQQRLRRVLHGKRSHRGNIKDENQNPGGQFIDPLEHALTVLEVYRLLAKLEKNTGTAQIPIELWVPGGKAEDSKTYGAQNPWTVRILDTQELMEEYVKGYRARQRHVVR